MTIDRQTVTKWVGSVPIREINTQFLPSDWHDRTTRPSSPCNFLTLPQVPVAPPPSPNSPSEMEKFMLFNVNNTR